MQLAKTITLSTHVAYAVAKLKARQYEDAFSHADKACRFSGELFAPALALRARIHACRDDRKAAIDDYLRAFSLNPALTDYLVPLSALATDTASQSNLAKAIGLHLKLCPENAGNTRLIRLLQPFAQSPMGAVWQSEPGTLIGWAVSPTGSAVVVEMDGQQWSLLPTLPTPGLHAHGIGQGYNGFSIRLPPDYSVCRMGVDGISLWGSPVAAIPQATATKTVEIASRPRRRKTAHRPPTLVDIVIPVYQGMTDTLACLDSLKRTTPAGAYRCLVVNDASPDSMLSAELQQRAHRGDLLLIERRFNTGFVGAVNTALALAENDVVLLNADTLLTEGWLSQLQQAAYSAADIGTATPMSNHAELVSHPIPMTAGQAPDFHDAQGLSRLFAESLAPIAVDIPVGVGFCLYIKKAVLDGIGLLDESEIFRGYGEETDFCLRASQRGWRHICAPRAYVAHQGSVSFSAEKNMLALHNITQLKLRYPDHSQQYQQFLRKDPLKKHRREMQRQWLITRRAGQGMTCRLHDQESYARHRPAPDSPDICFSLIIQRQQGRPQVELIIQGIPGLRAIAYQGTQLSQQLSRDLKASGIRQLIIGATAEWPHALIKQLTQAFPYQIQLEDYSAWCPRRYLLQAQATPCADPLPEHSCATCVETHGPLVHDFPGLTPWRRRQAALLQRAESIIAPASSLLERHQRRYPDLKIQHRRHHRPTPRPQKTPRCFIVPALQHAHHGYQAFLAHARRALRQNLGQRYIVIGEVMEPRTLANLTNVHMIGSIVRKEQIQAIRAHRGDAILDCSPWPGDPLAWASLAEAAQLPLVSLHG